VLGDNRSKSEDSRYFGFVKKIHVLGVAKVFPWASRHQEINDVWKNFFVK
ncbi:S26 family signal peptidase, partial [Oenococcus oeni]